MNPQGLTQQQNIEGMSSVVQEKLNSLRQIPQELIGKIPETVWTSLTADHRAEILKQYGLLEKYIQVKDVDAVETQVGTIKSAEQQISTEIPLDQLQGLTQAPTVSKPVVVDASKEEEIQGKDQFAEAVEQKNQIEATNMAQEKQSIKVEQQAAPERAVEKNEKTQQLKSNEHPLAVKNIKEDVPQEKIVPKFSGYPVAENIPDNVTDIVENGSARDGSTWTASLIQKILAVFTN
jgi:hypothetical protein